MTSQKDQLQTLIADIDKVLQKASPRLPWVISGEVAQQRRVLERVRSYLVSLQKQASDGTLGAPRVRSNLSTYDIQYQPSQVINLAESQVLPSQQAAAQQILHAVMQEIEQLRTGLTQPLQADLAALQQQREALVQEIRKLESQRHQYSLAQQQANQQQIISEFLKVLMGRLQENLTQQISQTLTTALSESLAEEGRPAATSLSGNSAGTPLLHPAQRLEELQMLQARSDQLLMTLDSTLSVLFEALHRNVHSYEESLSRGLERMHDLGQQGEVMFTALVSHLAQQLGREASSYLQSSLQTPSLEATSASNSSQVSSEGQNRPNAAVAEPPVSTPPTTPENISAAELTLPYPGAELRQQPDDWTALTPEVGSLDNLDIDPLSLDDLNLDNVEALLGEDVSELDAPLAETNSPELLSNLSEFSGSGAQSTELNSDMVSGGLTPVANGADLAAELDFLQQLNQALQEETSEAKSTAPQASPSPQPGVSNPTASTIPGITDVTGAPNELDEFYTSLFGQDAIATSDSNIQAVSSLEQPIVSDLENISTEAPDSIAEIELDESIDLATLADNTVPPIADLTAAVAIESEPTSSPAINQVSESAVNSGTDLFGNFTDLENLENVDAAIASEPNPEPDAGEAGSPIFDLEDFSTDFATTPDAAPNASDPIAELAELLGEEPEPDAPVASSAPTVSDVDQLASFSEATSLDETLPNLLPTEASLASSDSVTNWLEDQYTLAAPDESLLDTDDLGEANDITLLIDDQLVQQLNQDLSNLESNNSEFSLDIDLSTVPANPTDSTTLDDLFPVENEVGTTVPTSETPTVEESASSDLTLEALDDFFGDLEPTDAPSNSEPEPPTATTAELPTAQYPTEVDTQSITLDDVFGDLLPDEKKKI